MPLAPRHNKPKIALDAIGAAGVYFVVMRLSPHNLVALPTIRNTAGIDVLVSTSDGSPLAALQVKTSQKRVTGWPTPAPGKCLTAKNAYYVFLRWIKDRDMFEGFLVHGREVRAQVARNLEAKRWRGSKPFPAWHLPFDPSEQARLREAWENWTPR
ncbi:hypothetical protein ACFL2T_00300 [Elusimicrobiota bacterium]